jgi:hypothetical protein
MLSFKEITNGKKGKFYTGDQNDRSGSTTGKLIEKAH